MFHVEEASSWRQEAAFQAVLDGQLREPESQYFLVRYCRVHLPYNDVRVEITETEAKFQV